MKFHKYNLPSTYFILVGLMVFYAGLSSCKAKKNDSHQLILDSRYAQIKSINSFANCLSPQGKYTTEVRSFDDGTCYFIQVSDDRSQPFSVKLDSENKGYMLDENEEVIDTLSSNTVLMIRSHDFHRIQTNPSSMFHDINFVKEIDNKTEHFSAKDNLSNAVNLFYNRKEEHISKIELLNPLDTTELIEITHKAWRDSEFGQLVKEIEIIQAKKDTFYFNFEYVHINKN
jgi:hypothetical protein